MLNIQCAQCGKTLKGKEVVVTSCDTYIEGVKYQMYAVACPHCGGSVIHERYAKKEAENRAKAMAKAMKKTGKSEEQIVGDGSYVAIMRKVGNRARSMMPKDYDVRNATLYVNLAFNELPENEKEAVLAYEDKLDMLILATPTNKSTAHIKNNSMLLLTQGIIMSAIEENDEDFFKTQYGEYIVDLYNAALSVHKAHDYGITAELLLEKMRQGKFKMGGEEQNA